MSLKQPRLVIQTIAKCLNRCIRTGHAVWVRIHVGTEVVVWITKRKCRFLVLKLCAYVLMCDVAAKVDTVVVVDVHL